MASQLGLPLGQAVADGSVLVRAEVAVALARLAAAHAPPVAEAVAAAQRRTTRVLRGALSSGAGSGVARSAPTSTQAVASLVGRGAPAGIAPPPAAPGEG